jgi:hypothetical protein
VGGEAVKPYIIAVTGGRDFDDYRLINSTLDSIHTGGHILLPLARVDVLVYGGANGADDLAMQWAVLNWVQLCEFRVTGRQWQKNGRGSGPLRNRLMLEVTRPNLLVAFPGGSGTANCVKTARELGIVVLEVKP